MTEPRQLENPGKDTRLPNKRTICGLFFVLLIIYHANGKPIAEVDCVAAPYTAWAIIQHGSVDLYHYPKQADFLIKANAVRETEDGKLVTMRPLGSVIAAMPVIAPFAIFRDEPFGQLTMLQLGKLTGALSVAGAAVFFFLICCRLVPSAAWPTTILFALGTTLWPVASQALWMHGPATLALCAGLYVLIRDDGELTFSRGILAGLLLGLAIFVRPATVFFAMGTGGVSLLQRRWKLSFGLMLGGCIPVVVLLMMNYAWFGHPFLGGYHNDNWETRTSLGTGISGLLLAPSRGVFIYTPALLLLPVGCWMLWRQQSEDMHWIKGLLAGWLGGGLLTLLFYARWHDWRGGWCYGPRFLAEAMPVCCLLFGFAYAALRPQWRWMGITLVLFSVSVHFLGVAAGRQTYCDWQWRHPVDDGGRSLFSWNDTQIEAHARGFLSKIEKLTR